MSEYQYYEWQTVDRPLTPTERAEVNRLSSHIEVNSRQAVVTYEWGDFKHDPKQVLLKYFDGFYYLANWGSLQLMFRFPTGLLDPAAIEPYLVEDIITLETHGDYQVLNLDFNEAESESWMESQSLSDFIDLRAELLDGDYRLLYLAWLKAAGEGPDARIDIDDEDESDQDEYEEEYSKEEQREPPIPPGLKSLSPALQSFVQVFEIDPFLVQAAAETSPDRKSAKEVDYRVLVAQLSQSERDDFIVRLAQNEPGLAASLRKRLSSFLLREHLPQVEPPALQELLIRADQLERAAEKRRDEAARQKFVADMKTLAKREEQAWREIEGLLDSGRKNASVYDQATERLEQLEKLAEFQDTRNVFEQRVQTLASKYAARSALMGRWREKGWI